MNTKDNFEGDHHHHYFAVFTGAEEVPLRQKINVDGDVDVKNKCKQYIGQQKSSAQSVP